MNFFSNKPKIILLSAAILIAAVFAAVLFWHSSSKEISAKKEQPVDSQNIPAQNPEAPAPSSSQDSQANQADQISAIDKSAQENLGGDYKVDGASFVAEPKEENGVKVEVGDKSAKEVLPDLTLSRWEETKMTLKPNLDGIAAKEKKVSFEKDKIKFDTLKIGYSLENLPVSEERPEGGFEYNIVLKEKPATNVVSLGIETENLDFFYQPALNAEPLPPNGVSATQTDIFDKDGKSISNRPENVVGSYAVYYKGGVSGDYSALGGKNYMTGKAFHIYRPKIEDSAGKSVWGDLHINEKAGLLTVTIPQDFLDKAVYPVRHAAGLEFGWHTAGSTLGVLSPYMGISHWVTQAYTTPAFNGSLDSVVLYTREWYGANYFATAIYSDNAGVPNAKLASVDTGTAGGATFDWVSTNLSYANIIAGTQYWLGIHPGTSTSFGIPIYYDIGAANQSNYINAASWPGTWPSGTNSINKVSIYANYTSAAPAGTPINIKSNVNFKTNVNFK